eukprot:TRINITY_DN12910_c0_g2_i1.p1 TRINITY_DN12910_c0_g2~~TRINITY_DN12910_c0_g2_i1.p1  ORF type:complete len:590 (+),score=142.61 TRINITY_DN12910_c0_g2_i1:1041-2810(+)
MTPYQLAPSEKIREVLVRYSSPPYKTKPEDVDYLNSALREQNILIKVKGGSKKPPISSTKSAKTSKSVKKNLAKMEKVTPAKTANDLDPGLNAKKELLLNMLTQIQEHGIKSYQHIKRPYLFSGSWLEGVNSIEDFMNAINSTSPSEAVLKVFNVLHPCNSSLPSEKGDEATLAKFYEEKSMLTPEPIDKHLHVGSMERERYIRKLEADVKTLKAQVEASASEKESFGVVEESKGEVEGELQEARRLIEELKEINEQINEKYLVLKNQIGVNSNTVSNKDLGTAREEINDLKRELEVRKQEDIALRFKAGQAFLASIENAKANNQQLIEEDRQDFDPEDDYAIIRLLKSLKEHSLNLQDKLAELDNTGEGELLLSQFTTFLESLQLQPKDIVTLVKIAENTQEQVTIKDFVEECDNRAKAREEWEGKLIERVLEYFSGVGLPLADAFGFFDSNQNGMIEFEEMIAAFNAMKIKLPRQDLKAIFTVFDKDMSGSISLEEFEERLMEAHGKKEENASNLKEATEEDANAKQENVSIGKEETEINQEDASIIKAERKKKKQLPGKNIVEFNDEDANPATSNKGNSISREKKQ